MSLRPDADTPTKTCTVDGCDRPHKERGLCNMHRMRLRRQGLLQSTTAPRGITRGRKLGPYTTTAGRLEDLQWMLETGESAEMAARRLALTPSALARWLTRHGEHDLARVFYGIEKRSRQGLAA